MFILIFRRTLRNKVQKMSLSLILMFGCEVLGIKNYLTFQ